MARKSQVTLKCISCGSNFQVINCRKDKAKCCSKKCSAEDKKGKPSWNAGRSYEDCFSAERIREIKSKTRHPGESNGMYGKKHSSETKQKISSKNKGKIGWNKGLKFPGIHVDENRFGENNPYVKRYLADHNIDYTEYLARKSQKELYQGVVTQITRMQPIHILEHYEKRGKAGVEGAYNLDHIYSIDLGFKNSIPPEFIGDLTNLRFIPWKENNLKGNKFL